MSEPTITAEDLTLYALQLLEGDDAAQVELLLQTSKEAREELARIQGDLALFAMGTEPQALNPLTRQRLMKAVARERRSSTISISEADVKPRSSVPIYVSDQAPLPGPVAEEALEEITPATWAQIRDSLTRERSFHQEAPSLAPASSKPAASPVFRSDDHLEEVPAPQPRLVNTPLNTSPRLAYGPPASASSQTDPFAAEDQVQDRFVPSKFAFTSFETPDEEKSAPGVNRWFAWTGWAVAAALVAAGAFALKENFGLRRLITLEVERSAQAEASSARAQLVLQTLQSGASQRFVLAKTDTAPVPTGRVAYLPERATLIFQGSNLEPLAPYKTYELWLLPEGEGKQPVPAGTFKPDVRGYASVLLPQMPKGIIAGNFGVTIEDEGGSSTPSLPILLIGQQS